MRQHVPSLRTIYNRWRAAMILRVRPRAEWPMFRMQISAASALRGKRSSFGLDRKWQGNYLSLQGENPDWQAFNDSVRQLKNSDRFENVLFSSYVTKTNRFNKPAERVLLVSDQAIYKLDANKFKPMRRGMPIQEAVGLSLSPGRDQLVVIHSNKGNDLVVTLKTDEERVGELVGVICSRYQQLRGTDLTVNVANKFPCMLGNKSRSLRVEVSPEAQLAAFKKDSNNGIVYMLPSQYAIKQLQPIRA